MPPKEIVVIKFSKHSGVGLHLLLWLWACIAPAGAAIVPFDRFVVFGTSLSDPGNYFALQALTPSTLVRILRRCVSGLSTGHPDRIRVFPNWIPPFRRTRAL